MKYLIQAVVNFEVEADSRAAAHVAAVDALTAAELPGFDLGKLDVTGSISTGTPVYQNSGKPLSDADKAGAIVVDRREMSTDFPGKPFGRGDTVTIVESLDE